MLQVQDTRSNPGPGRGQSRRVGINQARRRYFKRLFSTRAIPPTFIIIPQPAPTERVAEPSVLCSPRLTSSGWPAGSQSGRALIRDGVWCWIMLLGLLLHLASFPVRRGDRLYRFSRGVYLVYVLQQNKWYVWWISTYWYFDLFGVFYFLPPNANPKLIFCRFVQNFITSCSSCYLLCFSYYLFSVLFIFCGLSVSLQLLHLPLITDIVMFHEFFLKRKGQRCSK